MSTKKTIYLVRHGQSQDNAAPVYQTYSSPLSPIGKEQAKKIAERATHLQFDALLTSPQQRAQQTAQVISEVTGKHVETAELFIERFKPTAIEGKPWTDPVASHIWKEWEESLVTPDMQVEDGENFESIIKCADKALRSLEERKEESFLVVSHGHFIRTIIARVMLGDKLTGATLRRFYELISLENTGITVLKLKDAFEEDFRWRIWTLNDHSHFAE